MHLFILTKADIRPLSNVQFPSSSGKKRRTVQEPRPNSHSINRVTSWAAAKWRMRAWNVEAEVDLRHPGLPLIRGSS